MRKGFTLIELLIVITIIMILLVFILININSQIAKANDAKRKSDLYTLHNAIEEYDTDHAVFPAQNTVTCGSAGLAPYIKQVPCDPKTRGSYGYLISASTGGYRVCAVLEDKSDPAIAAMGCGTDIGCGLVGGYNYCLAQGVSPSAIGTADQGVAGGNPTPTPPGGGGGGGGGGAQGGWACGPIDDQGNSYCRFYEAPSDFGCTQTYPAPPCDNICMTPNAQRCTR